MTRLFIPALGTELTLARDWTFPVYHESRNDSLVAALGLKFPPGVDYWKRQKLSIEATLPAGVVLKVDRVFIRQGSPDFDSVTFFLKASAKSPVLAMGKTLKKSARFWVKLADANNLEFVETP